MKRVLQIMGGLNRGGLESFVMNIYRVIDRNEVQFDFLLTQISGGEYVNEAKSLGANVYSVPPRNKGVKKHLQSLDIFFREHHEYIAVHEHISSLTSISPAFYAKKYGIPVRILHAHSSSVQKSLRFHYVHVFLHYYNKCKVRRLGTHFFGCSDKALDWMYCYTGVRSRARMLNNGIECEAYRFCDAVRSEVRKVFNLSDDDFVIGHVGRFIPLKNQSFLIDILCEMKKTNPNAKLLMVGDGETKESIKKKTIELHVENDVIFTGVRGDVNRIMQAMDVFVMPSWFEGLPVSLVEAQASGLPIVASDTISSDSDLSGTILFKSIQEPAIHWAKEILAWKLKHGRPDNISRIIDSGFDSISISCQLLKIYEGKL